MAELVNLKRRQRNALPMEPELIACYLAAFPATPTSFRPPLNGTTTMTIQKADSVLRPPRSLLAAKRLI